MSDHTVEGALLELKLIGDISGAFRVARYQRGFRWGKLEVERLLNDIWESKGEPYSLQPIVVKRDGETAWELVDGQQRLTTLFLIFVFMQREKLQNSDPPYSITYDTRPDSQAYLHELNADRADSNIDFFHLAGAYECIRAWFDAHGARRQYVANKFYGYLFESVRVIWYEAPKGLDSTTLFTRLNVGRIPLTDAELFKALLLSRSRGTAGATDRTYEIAAQWDGIERDLRHPDVWTFVADETTADSPTRITLLLDKTKSAFGAVLDTRIRETLDLTPSGVTMLSYEADTQKCARLLLLMNVETVRRMKDSTERYSFRVHRRQAWSLEHIHAQHAENLTKAEQWSQA